MKRNILVTASTGNQASGLIRSLLPPPIPTSPTNGQHPPPEEEHEYHIYALTRRVSSTTHRSLRYDDLEPHQQDRLHIVEGNLENRASVLSIFNYLAKKDGAHGIWGVFVVLPYPGLGVDGSGEERMGKMMADLALEFRVECFIYSSAMRLGPHYEKDLKFSAKAKTNVEEYCQALGASGLPWTFLQPGFFMHNFEGFKGALAVAILKKGLKPETTISFVAAEDTGNLAAAIFRNHEPYHHRSLLVVSEFMTLMQIEDAHQEVTGKSLHSAPTVIGWGLNKGSAKTRELLVHGLELNHECRTTGHYPTLQQEIEFTEGAYRLQTYREWKEKRQREVAEEKERGIGSPLASPLSGRFRP